MRKKSFTKKHLSFFALALTSVFCLVSCQVKTDQNYIESSSVIETPQRGTVCETETDSSFTTDESDNEISAESAESEPSGEDLTEESSSVSDSTEESTHSGTGTSDEQSTDETSPNETEEIGHTAVSTTQTDVAQIYETTQSMDEFPEETEELTEEFSYTVVELNTVMYTTSNVNVRSGPSTDYERLDELYGGQQVEVTGQVVETGWYQILYNDEIGYVSGAYLQDELPTTEVAATSTDAVPSSESTTEAVTEPSTEAAAEATTSAPPAVSTIETKLNPATLNPVRSDFEPLMEQIDALFAEILHDDMTTYEKVKACYDYLINNCSYGKSSYEYHYIDQFFNGYKYEVYAYSILASKIGVCTNYSAAFAMLMRTIGLDCYVVNGQTHLAGGGYTGHAWCEMNLDGTIYVFDPQVEDDIAKGGPIYYYRFGKTYDEVPDKYILN